MAAKRPNPPPPKTKYNGKYLTDGERPVSPPPPPKKRRFPLFVSAAQLLWLEALEESGES